MPYSLKGLVLITTLLLLYSCCCGQSIEGIWKGKSGKAFGMLNSSEEIMEIEISNDSLVSGLIHNYYSKERFEHVKITGVINWKDSILNITEEKLISDNISKFYETCLGKMQLKLSRRENVWHLEGKWRDQSRGLF